MYAYYKTALSLAKVILLDNTYSSNTEETDSMVVPYAINMPKLFECYIRALIKNKISDMDKSNKSGESGKSLIPKLLPYVKNNKKDGMQILKESDFHISGTIVPDIILEYPNLIEKYKNYERFRIFDVKYKKTHKDGNLVSKKYRRSDRLQLLAYAYIYQCQVIGHIFPGENTIFGDENQTKLNIQPEGNPDPYYTQIWIGKNHFNAWGYIVEKNE